jgi:hypothetical protein
MPNRASQPGAAGSVAQIMSSRPSQPLVARQRMANKQGRPGQARRAVNQHITLDHAPSAASECRKRYRLSDRGDSPGQASAKTAALGGHL